MWYDFGWKETKLEEIKQETEPEEVKQEEFIPISKRDKMWYENYMMAKKYYDEFGDLEIPFDYKVDNFGLGRWLCYQKEKKNNLSLDDGKIKLLDDLNISWNNKKIESSNNKWITKYFLAKEYYEKEGNLYIPGNYEIDGIKLGKWIQLQKYNYKQNKLSIERTKLLEEIGMNFGRTKKYNKNYFKEDAWMEKYKLALEYYEQHQNLDIPLKYEVNGVKLGIWLYNQKRAYRQGKLLPSRIELLENIKVVWDVRNKDKIEQLKQLRSTLIEEEIEIRTCKILKNKVSF